MIQDIGLYRNYKMCSTKNRLEEKLVLVNTHPCCSNCSTRCLGDPVVKIPLGDVIPLKNKLIEEKVLKC
jgi:hypothetical protein